MFTKRQIYDALYPTLLKYSDSKEEVFAIIDDIYKQLTDARRKANQSGKELTKNDEVLLVQRNFFQNGGKFGPKGKYYGLLPYGPSNEIYYDLSNESFDDDSLFYNTPLPSISGGRRKTVNKKAKKMENTLSKELMYLVLLDDGYPVKKSMTKKELQKYSDHYEKRGGNILTSGIFKSFGDFGSDLVDKYPKLALKYASDHPDEVIKFISSLV